MKKHWWGVIAAAAAGAVVSALVKPDEFLSLVADGAMAFGQWLRALSLSGTTGDLTAWAICLTLSLLPVIFILLARRKRKQASDVLWPFASAGLMAALYFLINPSLAQRFLPAFVPSGDMAGFASVLPLYAALSLLMACILLRWSGSLADSRLIFWMRGLLLVTMLLSGFSMGHLLVAALEQPATFPPALAGLVADAFWLLLLDSARTLLAGIAENGWFHPDAERLALRLAKHARWALLAAAFSLAAQNILTLLMGRWLPEIQVSVGFLLTEMTLACGALLLARCLAAACRVKRDNDLMI